MNKGRGKRREKNIKPDYIPLRKRKVGWWEMVGSRKTERQKKG